MALSSTKILYKKAQELKPSLIIVLIILLFIAYIILIPPDTRDRLLGLNNDSNTILNETTQPSRILLSKSPGEIVKLQNRKIEHPIPLIYLFSKTEPKDVLYLNHLLIERSFFSENSAKLGFHIDSPKNIERAFMTFNVLNSKGVVNIILNNYTILSDKFSKGLVNPIEINPSYLRDDNVLYFKLQKPFIFLKNKLELQNFHFVVEKINRDKLSALSRFIIDDLELNNIKQIKLYFIPSCDPNDIGKLTIKINNKLIYQSTPSCGNQNIVELSPSDLKEGENTLGFNLTRGRLRLDNIKVLTQLKQPSYPTYYFYISPNQKDLLNTHDAFLILDFLDNRENHLTIDINGIKIDLEPNTNHYSYKITSYLKEGNNYLKIEPLSDKVNIANLKVIIN